MPPALLILDAQNDFFGADNPRREAFLRSLAVINRASAVFHQRGWPVIFLQHTSPAKPAGSAAWQIYPAFERAPHDAVLSKTQHNAFDSTALQRMLSARGADVLVIAGYVTEYCVAATYRAATRLRYQAFVLQDGVASLEDAQLDQIEPGVHWLTVTDLEAM